MFNKRTTAQMSCLTFLLCLSVGANVHLIRLNAKLRASNKAGPPLGLLPGSVIQSISGMDFSNLPKTFSTVGRNATIILVYSPTCRYCEKNWPVWAHLTKAYESDRVRFIAADITATAPISFLNEKNIGNTEALHSIDPKDYEKLKISVTPQTILIGGDSRVRKVWSGVLSEKDVAEFAKEISSMH